MYSSASLTNSSTTFKLLPEDCNGVMVKLEGIPGAVKPHEYLKLEYTFYVRDYVIRSSTFKDKVVISYDEWRSIEIPYRFEMIEALEGRAFTDSHSYNPNKGQYILNALT